MITSRLPDKRVETTPPERTKNNKNTNFQCKMGKYDYYRPIILQKRRRKGNDSSNTCIMTTSRLSDKGVEATPPGKSKRWTIIIFFKANGLFSKFRR